jgi:hypothetical protein
MMNRTRLLALVTSSALGVSLAGCAATEYSGTFKGEATESATLKVAVMGAPEVATNETPPRKVPDATVSVAKDGAGYTVKFGACEMKGETSPAKANLVVAKGNCDVKIANWSGELPLSATLTFGEGGSLAMDVACTTREVKRNDITVMSYEWSFKGKK